jgi:hypothetical protein
LQWIASVLPRNDGITSAVVPAYADTHPTSSLRGETEAIQRFKKYRHVYKVKNPQRHKILYCVPVVSAKALHRHPPRGKAEAGDP